MVEDSILAAAMDGIGLAPPSFLLPPPFSLPPPVAVPSLPLSLGAGAGGAGGLAAVEEVELAFAGAEPAFEADAELVVAAGAELVVAAGVELVVEAAGAGLAFTAFSPSAPPFALPAPLLLAA